ncbi:hypothetical protein PG994_012743 [Apiospora phragmitis]|uniref:Fucose-specific lectin n=1 Tax=Apiospora phragmitis TaxID=2905665 RepID=A0ABR1TBC1_9PEZI
MSHSYDYHHKAARPTTATDLPQHCHQQEQPDLEVDTRDVYADDTTGLHRDVYAEDTTKQTAAPIAADYGDKNENGRGLHPGAGGANCPATAESTATPGQKSRGRRRLWVILGVISAIVIIVAAVLGGVLGSRAANTSDTESNASSGDGEGDTAAGNSGNDTALPSAPLKYVRPGSSLAVTGWREGTAYHIRLFYQGPDQLLRYSNYTSTEPGWTKQPTLLDQLEYKAGVNTSLAAATSMESKEIMGEDKLIYLDDTNTMRLQLFRNDLRAAGARGALNDYPERVAPGSRLAAYWPSILSEAAGQTGGTGSGKLRWTRYWGGNNKANHDFWEHVDANVTASPGSGLAVVPASSRYANSGGFLFRRGDGKVFNSLADHYDGGFNGTAWDKGDLAKDLNGLTIPATSPVVAFTVARSADPKNNPADFVNTYILYVGGQGAVNMVWQDDEKSGWKGSVQYPAAFGGADPGTDIACLTPAAWGGGGNNGASDVSQISGAHDMCRCYFQAGGGRVREVQFSGSNWKNLGYLPID